MGQDENFACVLRPKKVRNLRTLSSERSGLLISSMGSIRYGRSNPSSSATYYVY
jgi:hypothetical protein